MPTNLKLAALTELEISGKIVPLKFQIEKNMLLADMKGEAEAPAIPDISTKAILQSVIGDVNKDVKDIIDEIPDIKFDLKRLLFAMVESNLTKGEASSALVAHIGLGKTIGFSSLPLVGKAFPKDFSLGIQDFEITFLAEYLTDEAISRLNINKLGRGISISTKLNIGEKSHAINITIDHKTKKSKKALSKSSSKKIKKTDSVKKSKKSITVLPSTATPKNTNSTQSGTTWLNLNKKIGPVTLAKIGFRYKNKKIGISLTASLSMGGITFALDGLEISSSMSDISPEFNLSGLSLEYKTPALYIGGALLRKTMSMEYKGKQISYDDYSGMAMFKIPSLTLGAMGSYADIQGNPSLFLYAFVDGLQIGQPYFVVSGLAIGFGYNRALNIPPINEIEKFPLVSKVMGTDESATLLDDLNNIQKNIPVELGQLFFAVGIKFNSFKIIEGFVLITIAAGQRFELHVIGVGLLCFPPKVGGTGKTSVSPLAQIEIIIKASFLPKQGLLSVDGILTSNSYILSRDCHLTGGFALYSWFNGKHEGDFVLTAGGYHPDFQIPTHYPQHVPRIGLSWQPDSYISITGGLYFALCPHLLMAGGKLEASWKKGNINASFIVAANFLVAWQPFSYHACIYASIHAAYTVSKFGFRKRFSANVDAYLTLQGPDFSGTARIDLSVFSFTINFGATTKTEPKAINWNAFKQAFLPADNAICGISVKSGLLPKSNDEAAKEKKNDNNLGIINPKDFCLITNSAIPSNHYTVTDIKENILQKINNESKIFRDMDVNQSFGIGSMAVPANNLKTRHTIKIYKDNSSSGKKEVTNEFKFVAIKKNMPTGLWGTSLKQDLNSDTHIKDVLSGFEMLPAAKLKVGRTQEFNLENFTYDCHPYPYNLQCQWDVPCRIFGEGWNESFIEGYTYDSELSKKKNELIIMTKEAKDNRNELLDRLLNDLDEPIYKENRLEDNDIPNIISNLLVLPQLIQVQSSF